MTAEALQAATITGGDGDVGVQRKAHGGGAARCCGFRQILGVDAVAAPGEGKCQDALADGDLGEHAVDEVGGGVGHATAEGGGAETAPLAEEGGVEKRPAISSFSRWTGTVKIPRWRTSVSILP